jgi:hypothetical protein
MAPSLLIWHIPSQRLAKLQQRRVGLLILKLVRDMLVRFQVLMVTSVKMTAFWYIVLCRLVAVDNVSEVLTASVILMMEAVSTFEILICFYRVIHIERNPYIVFAIEVQFI